MGRTKKASTTKVEAKPMVSADISTIIKEKNLFASFTIEDVKPRTWSEVENSERAFSFDEIMLIDSITVKQSAFKEQNTYAEIRLTDGRILKPMHTLDLRCTLGVGDSISPVSYRWHDIIHVNGTLLKNRAYCNLHMKK